MSATINSETLGRPLTTTDVKGGVNVFLFGWVNIELVLGN